jgi:hypothetical protein
MTKILQKKLQKIQIYFIRSFVNEINMIKIAIQKLMNVI